MVINLIAISNIFESSFKTFLSSFKNLLSLPIIKLNTQVSHVFDMLSVNELTSQQVATLLV